MGDGRGIRFAAVAVVAFLSALALPGSALAGGPGKWTNLATLDSGSDTAGMLRTGDGNLHLVWLKKRGSNGKWSYGTSTISQAGKLLATGTAISNWSTLFPDPQLVKNGSGLRLIFEGSNGSSGCYVDAVVFTATSSTGSTWNLVLGSMDQHTATANGALAATTESNGTTPVAAFGSGSLYHVGVDPNCPASSPDHTIPVASGNAPNNPSIVTAQNGSIWVATFQAFSKEGYFIDQILPTAGSLTEAPGSQSTAAHNNQPLEPVALAARTGGGVYMAYCAASSSQSCAHIDLWKVGTSAPKVVPGSANTTGARVALTAEPNGRLAVVWYDENKNLIHAVRTNPNATSFGVVRTIKPPSSTSVVYALQAQGSSGRLDVILNDLVNGQSNPDLFQTQILPGLSLRANPHSFSHKHAAKVTFTVSDAGQPVAGAKVSCLGKNATTSGAGTAKLAFHKGAPTGKHTCTAKKGGYAAAKTTIKVT